jgi:hypothetical protein
VEALTWMKDVWKGPSLEEILRIWCENKNLKRYKALPIIISWGTWIARNVILFEDKNILDIQCTSQGLNILSLFKQIKNEKTQRKIHVEEVNRLGARAYFDGVTQDDP